MTKLVVTKPAEVQRIDTRSTASLTTTKPLDIIRAPRREERPQATLYEVVKAKFATYAEAETAKADQQIAKQTTALVTIHSNLTEVARTQAELQVFLKNKQVEFLDAQQRVQRIEDQMLIERDLFPKQLRVQETLLDAAQQRAEADLIAARTTAANAAANAQRQEEMDRKYETRRIERMDEREEGEHRLAMTELHARERAIGRPAPARPNVDHDGDLREATIIAEDVANGHVVTDAAHLYHSYAAVHWIGCLRRGIEREAAVREIAAKVHDRITRHPLTERDARTYHQRYLDARQQYDAERAATAKREADEAKTRDESREREARRFEARAVKDAEVKKAELERDAALARERTARTFMGGGYNPKDDVDVVA